MPGRAPGPALPPGAISTCPPDSSGWAGRAPESARPAPQRARAGRRGCREAEAGRAPRAARGALPGARRRTKGARAGPEGASAGGEGPAAGKDGPQAAAASAAAPQRRLSSLLRRRRPPGGPGGGAARRPGPRDQQRSTSAATLARRRAQRAGGDEHAPPSRAEPRAGSARPALKGPPAPRRTTHARPCSGAREGREDWRGAGAHAGTQAGVPAVAARARVRVRGGSAGALGVCGAQVSRIPEVRAAEVQTALQRVPGCPSRGFRTSCAKYSLPRGTELRARARVAMRAGVCLCLVRSRAGGVTARARATLSPAFRARGLGQPFGVDSRASRSSTLGSRAVYLGTLTGLWEDLSRRTGPCVRFGRVSCPQSDEGGELGTGTVLRGQVPASVPSLPVPH